MVDEKGPNDVHQLATRGSDVRPGRPGGDQGVPRPIEWSPELRAQLDVLPRQVARFVDPVSASEWVVDARLCGAHVQVRAVEYASDGSWMPHVWRQVPEGASVWFVAGHGVEVRGGGSRASQD